MSSKRKSSETLTSNACIEKKRCVNEDHQKEEEEEQDRELSQDITTAAAADLSAVVETTRACIVCNTELSKSSMEAFETHVNRCLDDMINKADSMDSDKEEERIKLETDSKKNIVDSWTKLFSSAAFKIRGIWSNRKQDIAPGMNENERSWFGEPKSESTKTKKQRPLPYYKRLAGTKMVVDAFSFGDIPDCEGYLLSHFHGDHYGGLSANWTHGPIYCSEITARLVELKLKVATDFIYPLPMNTPCPLPGTDGITVTLIDANHCPGAVIFLVTVGKLRYLHTGDFRACPKMCLHPLLRGKPLDIVYLDTTYLDPKYSFPSQDSCIRTACELARRHQENTQVTSNAEEENKISTDHQKKLLVVVGTYSLGKENLFIEIAKTLNSKIFVTDQKRAFLQCFHNEELDKLLTDQGKEAQVHVIPLGHIQPENLNAYFHSLEPYFSQMIAFRPTGWTFQTSADSRHRSLESIINNRPSDLTVDALKPYYTSPNVKIYGVPYSEHSSFRELALFVASLDIRRIVPTVNVHHEGSRAKMGALFEQWYQDRKDSNGTIEVIDYPSVDYW